MEIKLQICNTLQGVKENGKPLVRRKDKNTINDERWQLALHINFERL